MLFFIITNFFFFQFLSQYSLPCLRYIFISKSYTCIYFWDEWGVTILWFIYKKIIWGRCNVFKVGPLKVAIWIDFNHFFLSNLVWRICVVNTRVLWGYIPAFCWFLTCVVLWNCFCVMLEFDFKIIEIQKRVKHRLIRSTDTRQT
jgi:hypothetical protein